MLHPPNREMRSPPSGKMAGPNFRRRRPFFSQDVRKLGGAVLAVLCCDCVSMSPRLADEGRALAVLAAPGGRVVR